MPIDRERFDRPVKTCRDLLVDVVSSLLGVPILGEPADPSSISVGALVTAAQELDRARLSLASSEQTPGQHLTASGEALGRLDRTISAAAAARALSRRDLARLVRASRRHLFAAERHLSAVMWSETYDE
jgi:hypothetical protein